MIHHRVTISHKAHVESNCTIGAGTVIRQFASVTRRAIIGEDCNIWPYACIDGAHIGDRCKIACHTLLPVGIFLSDDVFVAANVSFCNDMWPEVDPEGFDEATLRAEHYTVVVGRNSSICAGAVILPGVTIGRYCVVGAGVVVDKDMEDHTVWRRDGIISTRPTDTGSRRMRLVA